MREHDRVPGEKLDDRWYYVEGEPDPRLKFSSHLKLLESCPVCRSQEENRTSPEHVKRLLARWTELGRPEINEWPERL